MFLPYFDELLEHLHGGDEFLGKFLMLLILPGSAERDEAGLQGGGTRLHVIIEAFEFLGEATHFFGIHDGLGHEYSGGLDLWNENGIMPRHRGQGWSDYTRHGSIGETLFSVEETLFNPTLEV